MYEPVRNVRIRNGISQLRLAQTARRSVAWFQHVEAGCLTPSREDAEKIARLLGRPVEDLFTRTREVAAP
jgi:DNA-binding XRE family transcriptional regulator